MILHKITVCSMLTVLLLSGCGGGGDGGGPKEAVVTVIASPNPATGEPFDDGIHGTQIRWDFKLTFTESNGVGVTIATYDREVEGNNGYISKTTKSENISISANNSTSASGWITSGSTSGKPKYNVGTVKYTFYGTDDNGNSIEVSVTITLQ